MVKKYAYILDEHLGEVHFPLSAAQHMESSVNDLREKYQSDEHVIFTANKQLNQNNEFEYRAVSVVKPKELLAVCGRITDIVPNRFCYTEVKKYGKVFVPFSARLNATSKHWLGKGAEKNKEVNLKIFPQPQINGCNYVAYSISLPSEGGIVETTKVNGVEAIYDQIGIIVEIPPQPNADLKVFCNVSGFARLPGAFRKSWMTKGRHIKYDAIKQQHPSQEKIHWAIRKCADLGQLFKKVDENPMKPDSLTLELCAVINRVVPNPPNRCAWFWNDFIGRIYCYPNNYTPGLNVMECVKCKVVYTGAFDDVPWSAYDIELLGEDDDVRFAAAQMLVTRDDWTVTYAENKKISFIGFLESPSMSPQQCFLAWTDLADSDAPPSVGQKCRATVYYQIRKDKQQWRAVLITPLNPNGIPTSNHPLYSGSREIIWPDPIEPPVVESSPATTVSSPGITSFGPPGFDHMTNIPPPIGAGMRPYNSMVKMNGLAKQESSSSVLSMISNGHERNGTTHQYSHPPPPVNQNTFTLDSMTPLPPLEGLTFAHLQNADNPRSSPMERNGASGTDFMHMFTNGWQDPKHKDPNQALFHAFGPGSFSRAEIDTRDMETQTDTIVEHEVLRDVLKNTDCLTVILKNFPDHTAKIMSMSALLR